MIPLHRPNRLSPNSPGDSPRWTIASVRQAVPSSLLCPRLIRHPLLDTTARRSAFLSITCQPGHLIRCRIWRMYFNYINSRMPVSPNTLIPTIQLPSVLRILLEVLRPRGFPRLAPDRTLAQSHPVASGPFSVRNLLENHGCPRIHIVCSYTSKNCASAAKQCCAVGTKYFDRPIDTFCYVCPASTSRA